ncbi:MAG: tRNA (adenosine(37)-N6)-dimethylallyltransferase MiaA [Candidatus Omnitrophica bacterium]|nr:tRNA (adenosine(37)-N6)-dimethylallyltransferase MiaA [Candidatus Omnitrophota bacterium]
MKHKIIFLIGPTASGKTEIAVKLAKKINAEIISCDSMQVYKGMQILSDAPSEELRKKVCYHLIAHVKPTSEYNVVRFCREATGKIKEILNKGKIPLFVGGTGLYYKAILDGIFYGDTEDKNIRARLYEEAKKYGGEFLYKRLKEIDPQASLKIHHHDLRRIVRALEVYEKTGIPISVWQKKAKGIFYNYDVKIFGLLWPKELLFKRIDQRIESMFKRGLIGEVRNLLKINLSRTARQALGVKEISGYLEGKYSLEEAKKLLKLNTYRLVKKQLTWFKRDKRIIWIKLKDSYNYDKILKDIIKIIK